MRLMGDRLFRVSVSGSGEQEGQLLVRMVVGSAVVVVVVVEIDGGEMDAGAALEGGEEGGGHIRANPVGHAIQLVTGKEGCAIVGLRRHRHRRRRRRRRKDTRIWNSEFGNFNAVGCHPVTFVGFFGVLFWIIIRLALSGNERPFNFG